jgi:hypothetical protein
MLQVGPPVQYTTCFSVWFFLNNIDATVGVEECGEISEGSRSPPWCSQHPHMAACHRRNRMRRCATGLVAPPSVMQNASTPAGVTTPRAPVKYDACLLFPGPEGHRLQPGGVRRRRGSGLLVSAVSTKQAQVGQDQSPCIVREVWTQSPELADPNASGL